MSKVRTIAGERRYKASIGSDIKRRAFTSADLTDLNDELTDMRQQRSRMLQRIAKHNAAVKANPRHRLTEGRTERADKLEAIEAQDVLSLRNSDHGVRKEPMPHWLFGGGSATQRELRDVHFQLKLKRT